jgi:hypothetical protein
MVRSSEIITTFCNKCISAPGNREHLVKVSSYGKYTNMSADIWSYYDNTDVIRISSFKLMYSVRRDQHEIRVEI